MFSIPSSPSRSSLSPYPPNFVVSLSLSNKYRNKQTKAKKEKHMITTPQNTTQQANIKINKLKTVKTKTKMPTQIKMRQDTFLVKGGPPCLLSPHSSEILWNLNLCRYCVCFDSPCKFMCTYVLLHFLDTVSLESYINSCSYSLSPLFST